MSATIDIVLGTVNAPYAKRVSAQELAKCLRDEAAALAMPGHMSSFLGEVDPALQEKFAQQGGAAALFLLLEKYLIQVFRFYALTFAEDLPQTFFSMSRHGSPLCPSASREDVA